MDIVAYTMEYTGAPVNFDLDVNIINFDEKYYEIYKSIYHNCFYDMRKALELTPYNCCDSIEQIITKKENIFLLFINNEMIGSVAVYGNEIDDLIVAKKYQNKGYGKMLLLFAINLLQIRNISPILLGVAEWNQKAISLYKRNDFVVSEVKTFTI